MSRTRRVKVSESQLERGPHGRFLCRWCKTEVNPPRRTFCSNTCVHEWKLRSDTYYVRKLVYERDGGICATCGLDTAQIDRELRRLRFIVQQGEDGHYLPTNTFLTDPRYQAKCDELGVPKSLQRLKRSLWEADHIVPVCEGGGGCDLAGFRTLCWRCHALETKALNQRRKGPKSPVQGSGSTQGA